MNSIPVTLNKKPILVLGATGKTGRRIAERLTVRGLSVRLGSRSGQPPFDWEDPSTWSDVLTDAAGVYISYYPDLSLPRAAETIKALVDLTLEKNVRRLVLLSGRGEEGAMRAETLLQASGAHWTILRASWFSQNFSESFLLEPILEGEVALPVRDVPEPFVDVDDIADVAVAALTDDKHIGQLYELTGPEALTFPEAVQEISKAAGKSIHYRTLTHAEFRAGLEAQGFSDEMKAIMLELFTELLDGRNAQVADGVQRALGREPRAFSDYVRATATTGVWNG